MAKYTENKEIESDGKEYVRTTATPENLMENLKFIYLAVRYPKRIQFRLTIQKDHFYDKMVISKEEMTV